MTLEQRQAFLEAGAAGRRARRSVERASVVPTPDPGPAPPIAPERRERPKPPPLTKRQAAKLRKRLVAERAEARNG